MMSVCERCWLVGYRGQRQVVSRCKKNDVLI